MIIKHSKIILSVIFLTVLFLVFFQKFFTKGYIPIPSDITVGMYYPWINNNYGYPVRVPFKNATLTDTVSQFWIWRNWAIDGLKSGRVNIWNPYSLAGYPLSPWFHTVMFQPTNAFYFIFNQTTAMGSIVAFQLIFILLTSYLFFHHITKSSIAAIFGSIVYSFSSYNIGWLTWGTVSFSLGTLPLILLYMDKISSRPIDKYNYLLLSLSVALCILGGHPQTIMYCLLICFIYYLTKLKLKLDLRLITPILLGVAMTSFVLLPSLEIISKSIRNKDVFIKNQNYSFLSYTDVVTSIISQNYFGNPGAQNYWGKDYTIQEKLCGPSILATLLSILYLITFKKKYSKTVKFGIILILCGILMATKYPLGWIIYYFKVPLISTSPASRSLILVVFGIAIISAESFKQLLNNKYNFLNILKSIFILLSIIIGLTLPLFISSQILKTQPADYQSYLLAGISNINVSFRNLFISSIVFLVSSSILLIYKYLSKSKYNYLYIVILLIPFIEGINFGWKYTPFNEPRFYFPSTPSIDFVTDQQKNSPDFFRIEREKAEILPPNMWQAYGLSSYSGYDPIYPNNYAAFLIDNKIINDYSRYFENDQTTIKYFQNLGLRYLFVINRDKNGLPSETGEPPYWTKNNSWKKVFQEKSVSVLENTDYSAPYGVVNNTKTDTVKLDSHSDDYWQFTVKNQQPSTFYLYENNFPGWSATVNGKVQLIDNYQGTFKSVKIDKGENKIIFKYDNQLLIYGLVISFISAILIFIYSYLFKKT